MCLDGPGEVRDSIGPTHHEPILQSSHDGSETLNKYRTSLHEDQAPQMDSSANGGEALRNVRTSNARPGAGSIGRGYDGVNPTPELGQPGPVLPERPVVQPKQSVRTLLQEAEAARPEFQS